MLFEESDYSDTSSDDELIIKIAPKSTKIPESLTIDALFQTRTEEQTNTPQKVNLEINESNEPKIDLIKQEINLNDYSVPDLQVINESIFNQTQVSFPTSVFSMLKTKPDINQKYPIKEFDLLYGLSYFESSLFDFTEETIYTLLYSLLYTGNDVFGKIILKKLDKMPQLNFSKFLFLFEEIINEYKTNQSLYIYPSLLCNPLYFEQTQEIHDDITLLFFSMTMCTDIVKHQYFCKVIEYFKFLNPNFNLINDLHKLIIESQIQGIGYLVTFMKISNNTADFFIFLYMSLINSLFDNDSKLPTELKEMIDHLIFLTPNLKELIDSGEEEKLLRSSAILSLIERVIVAAKILSLISHDQASKLCKSMKFNLICENGTYLFLLKEQLHVTLTQIEYIFDATLKTNNKDNPFFT